MLRRARITFVEERTLRSAKVVTQILRAQCVTSRL